MNMTVGNLAEKTPSSGEVKQLTKIKVLAGRTEYFGNITVFLHSLGSSAYRIEWFSRMTGASTSFSRLGDKKYMVMKQWPSTKKLPTVSCDFDNRKSALIHFLNNVDIIKSEPEMIYDAKICCFSIFSEIEKVKAFNKPLFPKQRLQGAIGRTVEIKNKSGKTTIAEGTLLQLNGANAEIKINKDICLTMNKSVQNFSINRVFIK